MDRIKEEISTKLSSGVAFEIPLFGGIPVPVSAVVTWGVMLFLVFLAIWLTRGLKQKPGKRQLVAELYVGFINNFCKENIGKHWRSYAPYLGTVGLFLAISNLTGLIGVAPPAKDLNVTAGLAIMSGILIYGSQFRYHGFRGGLKKFVEPTPLIAPLNVLEIIIRPLSLCMRLFGNILGGYLLMEVIILVCPVVLPVPFSLYFDIFDGILQAVVFVFLTTLFVSESIEE